MLKRRKKSVSAKLQTIAKNKATMKRLDEENKLIQAEIIDSVPDKNETPYGTLKVEERQNYSVPDNHALIKQSDLTNTIFINTATLSVTNMKKIMGEPKFNELVKTGVIAKGNSSKFFKLVEKKKK